MTTQIIHNDLAFTITVVSFPNAHIATITSADPSIGYRKVMRDRPSARLSLEIAQLYIERTF